MKKRKALSPKIRKQVYEKYNGHCAYCGCELSLKEMQIDHIESIRRHEEDDIDVDFMENYNPACRMCNFYKSTLTIEEFRNQLSLIVGRMIKRVYIFRLALKYDLITLNNGYIKFYFEKVKEGVAPK